MAANNTEVTGRGLRILKWLLRARAANGLRSPHLWILSGLLGLFAFLYYDVLLAVRDVYLILFFYPQIYAAIVYRVKGVIISGVVILAIVLPYALLISSDPYALLKLILLSIFAFLFNGLGATLLNYLENQLKSYDEILALNQQLSLSLQNLENTRHQLALSEKLNAIGEFAASVAHEINNPLAGVLIYSRTMVNKMAAGQMTLEEIRLNLKEIETATEHCSHVVHGLLDFARQSEPVIAPVALKELIDQVVTLVGHQAVESKVGIIREDGTGLLPVVGDSNALEQVIINLFVNAVQAMPDGGKLIIRTGNGETGWVKVEVEDTGTGIVPQNLDKLFTPFFTTRPKGLGLGLAVSYGIVQRHGGRIEVKSTPGKGSTFTVSLPVGDKLPPGVNHG